jgi:hypothetical protein
MNRREFVKGIAAIGAAAGLPTQTQVVEGETVETVDSLRVGIINIQPNDILVLKFDGILRPEACVNMREAAANHFGVKVLILNDGMDLAAVIRRGV